MQLTKILSPVFFQPDGQLDRPKLAAVVFSEPSLLKKIEDVIHPAVHLLHRKDLNQTYQQNEQAVVIYVVPLLFEKKWHQHTQKNIVITCNAKTITKRLEKKGWSAQAIEQRWAMQMPAEQKQALADYCVDNSLDSAHLKNQLAVVWETIKNLPSVNFSSI